MSKEKLGTCNDSVWHNHDEPHTKSNLCVNWREQPQEPSFEGIGSFHGAANQDSHSRSSEGGGKPQKYDSRLVVQMKGVEVVHEAAIQMSIDSYNQLQTNLDECQRQLLFVDYMAESVRVMSEECFVALCRQICKGCDEKPSYSSYYLGWSHGQYRCNASVLYTLRSGRTFLPSSSCVHSEGGERWYKTATEESIRKADEYEKHQH